jgi:hypothetical protein
MNIYFIKKGFLTATMLLIILVAGKTSYSQFSLRSPTKLGATVNCYAAGNTYTRTVDSNGLKEKGGFAFKLNTNDDAQAVFDDISPYVGVKEVIDVIATTDTKDAEACRSDNGIYYILYNLSWLKKLYNDTKSIWALRAIIAHEVGHIIYNHSAVSDGSERELELQADWYAGRVLAKMNAKIEEVEVAFRSKEFGSANATKTHPNLSQRLKAVRDGWNSVTLKNIPRSTVSANQKPTAGLIARCVFFGERITYVIDANNNIIGYNGNESRFIGKRIAPSHPGFIWMYAINNGPVYGVDSQGRIWNRTPWGIPFQIGVVQKP